MLATTQASSSTSSGLHAMHGAIEITAFPAAKQEEKEKLEVQILGEP